MIEARSPVLDLRARAMRVGYGAGVVATAAMAVHDGVYASYAWWFHVGSNLAFCALLAAGLVALRRGRDDLAAYVLPALTVIFSLTTLSTGLGPHPENFFGGWARWYPVLIAGTTLVSTARGAAMVTAIAIGWSCLYAALFVVGLDPAVAEPAISELVETSLVEAMTGALAIASISLVQRALDTAHAELMTSQRLAATLEARVAERTRDLDEALAERLAILNHLAEGLVAVDLEGVVRVANPALQERLGMQNPPVGLIAAEVLPDGLVEAIAEARSGAVASREIPLPGERVGRVAATPVRGPDGAVRGIVALVRDVTLEKEIDRMKTDFISTVSHELRTPLTSVLGFAKIIRSRLAESVLPAVSGDDPKLRRAMAQVQTNIDVVVSEGERLTALINDVLDISKMEAGRMEWRREPVRVADLVRRSADAVRGLLPEGGPTELRVEIEPDLPDLVGDEPRLVQVLVNLLSNAAKFTPSGHVALSARRVGGGVELAVQDTGAGIDPALHDAVFEKFRQVGDTLTDRPAGTGLGLPICRWIVRAHGSEISVDSALGRGSRFSFVLAAPAAG
jgi:signal transduction histidine kinase